MALSMGRYRRTLGTKSDRSWQRFDTSRILRQNDNLAPRVGRLLADILCSTSSHPWRLDVEYRYFGAPTKRAVALRSAVVADLQPLANRISGPLAIDTTIRRALADMLDPASRHELYLHFRERRKRGRPPLKTQRPDILAHIRTETDAATILVRREVATGDKLLSIEKKVEGRISRATLYRRLKSLGVSRSLKRHFLRTF